VLSQSVCEPFEFFFGPGHEHQIGALLGKLAGELLAQSYGSARDKGRRTL
jgi:hypothetical protein